jgi:hypothetical protein
MALHDIHSFMLIESPASESDEQFLATVEVLLREAGIVRARTDWVHFSAGGRFARHGTQFREFVCIAGSAMAMLMSRAGRDGGLSRTIILRGETDGQARCWEIRGGVESEFEPHELHAA